MNGRLLYADMEGWVALAIAILGCFTTEEAFRLLSGSCIHRNRAWKETDITEIQAMRDEGWTWEQIGEAYNISPSAAHHGYDRWLKKNK